MGTNFQNPAIEDLDLAGRRSRNAAPSNLPADYVTRAELEGVVRAMSQQIALLVDGSNHMLSSLKMNEQFIEHVLAATADHMAVNKGQMDAADAATLAAAQAFVNTAAAGLVSFPLFKQVWNTPQVLTLTIGTEIPSWVKRIYAGIVGGAGGGGGGGDIYHQVEDGSGWDGGDGGRLFRVIDIVPGVNTLDLVVGGFGTGGKSKSREWYGTYRGCGGGGGGGSKITYNGVDYVAGGAAGGGGFTGRNPGWWSGGNTMANGQGNNPGQGATIGINIPTALGGDQLAGADGTNSHTSDPIAFLLEELLAGFGVAGKGVKNGWAESGTSGAIALRW